MSLKDLLKKATKTTKKVANLTTAGKVAQSIGKVPAVKQTVTTAKRVPDINKLVGQKLANQGIDYQAQLKDQANRSTAAAIKQSGATPFVSPGATIVNPAINFNLSNEQIAGNISDVLAGNYQAQQAFANKQAVNPIAQAAQAPVGVAKSLGNLAVGAFELFPGAKSLTRDENNQRKQGLQFLEPKGQGQEIGRFAGDIGSFFLPGAAISQLNAAGRLGQLGTLIDKSKKLKGATGFLARLGGQVAEAGAVSAAQEGEINKNVGINAALTGAAGVLAPALGSVARGVARRASEIAIPTTKGIRDKLAKKGVNLANAVGEAGVSLTRESLANKLGILASKKSGIIDNIVDQATKANKKTYLITDFVDDLATKVLADKKLIGKLELTPATSDDIVSKINEVENIYKGKYKGKKFNLNDVQALKKELYQGLKNAFTKDSVREPAVTAGEKVIAKGLRQAIEKEAPELKALNEELGTILEGSRLLNERSGAYKEFFYDLMTGGIGAIGAIAGNKDGVDTGDVLTGAILLALARRGLNSTVGTTSQVKVSQLTEKLANAIQKNPIAAPAFAKFAESVKQGKDPQAAQEQLLEDILGKDYEAKFSIEPPETKPDLTGLDPAAEADKLLQELGIETEEIPEVPTEAEFVTPDGYTIIF